MTEGNVHTDGFDELAKLLEGFSLTNEKVLDALEAGAKQLVEDVRKLPRPRSRVNKSTHLLDTMTYKREKGEIEVGWGKYYGPMVEKGTCKMKASPHLRTTFQTNQKKYYETMKTKLWK